MMRHDFVFISECKTLPCQCRLVSSLLKAQLPLLSSYRKTRGLPDVKQEGVGNQINLKTDDGRESNFLPGTDNTL